MTIKKQTAENGKDVIIQIENRFDFSVHQAFRDAYTSSTQKGTKFFLDLHKTTYMDSSALGMILLLKDYAQALDGEIVIKKPTESVNKILEIAQFHRLLKIEH